MDSARIKSRFCGLCSLCTIQPLKIVSVSFLIFLFCETVTAYSSDGIIPNRYHVILKNNSNSQANLNNLRRLLGASYKSPADEERVVSSDDLYMFSATLTDKALTYVQSLPFVETIEPVRFVRADCENQSSSLHWGLQRISGREQQIQAFIYSHNGTGVTVYVVDSGVYLNHTEFGGRASFGTCIPTSNNPTSDALNHGTHVAGLVAGATSGVAKAANIVSIRIFDDAGASDTTYLADALRWIINDHLTRAIGLNGNINRWQHKVRHQPSGYQRPKSVINLSISSPGFTVSIVKLLRSLNDYGVVTVVSAANNKEDACRYTPSVSQDVLTVACTDATDTMCSDSNFGTCVDLFAPGANLRSASSSGINSFQTLSGTSQSTPLVAGLAAIYSSSQTQAPTLDNVSEWLKNTTTSQRVFMPYKAAGTPNELAFSGCHGDAFNHSYVMLNNTFFSSASRIQNVWSLVAGFISCIALYYDF